MYLTQWQPLWKMFKYVKSCGFDIFRCSRISKPQGLICTLIAEDIGHNRDLCTTWLKQNASHTVRPFKIFYAFFLHSEYICSVQFVELLGIFIFIFLKLIFAYPSNPRHVHPFCVYLMGRLLLLRRSLSSHNEVKTPAAEMNLFRNLGFHSFFMWRLFLRIWGCSKWILIYFLKTPSQSKWV